MAKSSKGKGNNPKYIIYLIGAVLLIGGFAAIVLWPKKTVDTGSIENWLTENGYDIFRPFRDNIAPGSVLRLEKRGQSLVIPAAQLAMPAPSESRSADISWRVESELDGLAKTGLVPGLQTASLKGSGATRAVVVVDKVAIREIPLVTLADAAKTNPQLIRVAKAEDLSMVLVSSVLEAGSIHCEFFSQDNAKLDLRAAQKQGKFEVGGSYEFGAKGELVSKTPLLLGYKAYDLKAKALVFGPDQTKVEVQLAPLTQKDIEERRAKLAEPQSLRSQFQVFALCIGLGNYRGARLDGAPDSAARVAAQLAGPGGSSSQVQLHKSLPGQRMGKDDVLKLVKTFVRDNYARANPRQHSTVLFYFCGHGLAEGLGRHAFLVPENINFDQPLATNEITREVIDVATVLDLLAPLAELRIVLMDSCRSHSQEDQQLLNAWAALRQNVANMRDIVDVLKFTSQTVGPSPVLFGGADGEPAMPVQAAWSQNGVGPLALRLDCLLDEVRRTGKDATPRQFIKMMQVTVPGQTITMQQVEIRAYTALRKDFMELLPNKILFGVSPTEIAARAQPYDAPVPDGSPGQPVPSTASGGKLAPSTASGVKLGRATNVSVPRITDFAYATVPKLFYALDWEGNLYTWRAGQQKPERMKTELHFPSIACTDEGTLYLHVADTHELLRAPVGGPFKPVASELYLGFLARGSAGKSVLLVEDDHTIGTADNVSRCSARNLEPIERFDTVNVAALVEREVGELIYSDTDEGTLFQRRGGKVKALCNGLERPAALALAADYIYCLGGNGRLLYRIDKKGRVDLLDLGDLGFVEKYKRLAPERGLFCAAPHVLWVAAGDGIQSLDLSGAIWQPISPSP